MRQKDAASWRTAATPRQKEVLHRLCGRWLVSHGYSLEEALRKSIGCFDDWAAQVDTIRNRHDGRLANFLVRTTSLRFPNTARTVKSMLGMATAPDAVASVWADAIPERRARQRAQAMPPESRSSEEDKVSPDPLESPAEACGASVTVVSRGEDQIPARVSLP